MSDIAKLQEQVAALQAEKDVLLARLAALEPDQGPSVLGEKPLAKPKPKKKAKKKK